LKKQSTIHSGKRRIDNETVMEKFGTNLRCFSLLLSLFSLQLRGQKEEEEEEEEEEATYCVFKPFFVEAS
jgi:hypothetical protein